MYKRILVPLDGSDLAEQVLPYVLFISKDLQSKIDLLQILPPGLNRRKEGANGNSTAIKENAEAYLELIRKSLAELGMAVSCSIKVGEPEQLIVEEAEKMPGTMVAMSTHGRTGVNRWLMGSITDKVLHAYNNSLLIVRPRETSRLPQEIKLKTMIVSLGGSTQSEEVLPHSIALAKPRNLKVILLRVVPIPDDYYRYAEYPLIRSDPAPHQTEQRARGYLDILALDLQRQGISCVEQRVLLGRPASVIVDIDRETPDNVVTMTTHGHSGFGRLLLGSVTNEVVRNCGSPVLVIVPQQSI